MFGAGGLTMSIEAGRPRLLHNGVFRCGMGIFGLGVGLALLGFVLDARSGEREPSVGLMALDKKPRLKVIYDIGWITRCYVNDEHLAYERGINFTMTNLGGCRCI